MDLTKFKDILGPISLNEEQEQAILQFFTEAKAEIEAKLEVVEGNEMINKADAEAAFEALKADAEKAFNLFAEDSEKAFNLFKEDTEKAFDLYSEDKQAEYSENLVKGLQELYEDLNQRVVKDFMESKEFKALDSIKKVITPMIVNESEQLLVEEIEKLKTEKESLLESSTELARTNVINKLIHGLPDSYQPLVKKFISEGKDEEEIYAKFAFMCEAIEEVQNEISETPVAASSHPGNKPNKGKETKLERRTAEAGNMATGDNLPSGKTANASSAAKGKARKDKGSTNISESVVKSKSKETRIQKKEKSYFTEEEEQLLNIIGAI